MSNYDSIDLDFSWDGDFVEGIDGDLGDTRDDYIRSLESEIHSVMRSEVGDWELDPGVGANLSDYRGEPNNRITATALEDRIVSRIVAIGIVKPEDVKCRVIPVGRHQTMASLHVNATATPGNRLEPNEPLAINLLYDSLEDSIFFLDESQTKRNARTF